MTTQHSIQLPEGHKPLTTRRDFLSHGLLGLMGYALLPKFGFANQALSQKMGLSAAANIPFVAFDCAGGIGLPGNFLVGNIGGPTDLISSYSSLGWNPRVDAIDTQFGLPMAGNDISKIRQGMLATASADALSKLRMGSICVASVDDTSTNPLSALRLVSRGSQPGSLIASALGMRESRTGGNSVDPFEGDGYRPIQVNNCIDLATATGLGVAFSGPVGESFKPLFRNAAKSLSHVQMSSLDARAQASIKKAYEEFDTTVEQSMIDPRMTPDVAALYGFNAQTPPTDARAISASIVANVLSGFSGPGVITIPGCDYHNQGLTATEAKDLEVGQQIGRAVELAHRLKKPLFFQIFTDGGVGAITNTRLWDFDASGKSMMVIGYYNPNGAPPQRRIQVGHYTNGEGVERQTLVGNSPAKATYAVLANYLSASGRIEDFEVVAPGVFSTSELDSILIF